MVASVDRSGLGERLEVGWDIGSHNSRCWALDGAGRLDAWYSRGELASLAGGLALGRCEVGARKGGDDLSRSTSRVLGGLLIDSRGKQIRQTDSDKNAHV